MTTAWSARGGRGEDVGRAVKEGDGRVRGATVAKLVGRGGAGGRGGRDGGGGGVVATTLAILHRLARSDGGGDLASLGLVRVVDVVYPGGELLVTNDDVPAADKDQVSERMRAEEEKEDAPQEREELSLHLVDLLEVEKLPDDLPRLVGVRVIHRDLAREHEGREEEAVRGSRGSSSRRVACFEARQEEEGLVGDGEGKARSVKCVRLRERSSQNPFRGKQIPAGSWREIGSRGARRSRAWRRRKMTHDELAQGWGSLLALRRRLGRRLQSVLTNSDGGRRGVDGEERSNDMLAELGGLCGLRGRVSFQ